MNTQHGDKIIENDYEYLVGILNQLRRYGKHHGMPSNVWSPNLVSEVLYCTHQYRLFSSNEVIWLSDNL